MSLDTNTTPLGSIRTPVIAAAILIGLAFAIDVSIPLGNGLGSLYVIPLLVLSFAGPFRWALYGAWLSSLLIAIRVSSSRSVPCRRWCTSIEWSR